MDITGDDTAYKLAAELPGMSEKEIEVVVSDDTLTLKGERSDGSFQRSFFIRKVWTVTGSAPTSPRAC